MNTNEIMNAMIFGDDGASKIEELSTDGGSTDAGKVLVVGDNGKIAASDLSVGEGEVAIDKTLSVNGEAADAKVVGDAISAVNGSLDDVKADLDYNINDLKNTIGHNTTESYTFTDGYRIATNGSIGDTIDITSGTSASFGYIITSCKNGDIFTITGNGGSVPRLWCFVDSSYKILANAAESVSATNLRLTATQDGYLIVNADINYTRACTRMIPIGESIDALSQTKLDINVLQKADGDIVTLTPAEYDFVTYPGDASSSYDGGYYDGTGAWVTGTGYVNYVLNAETVDYTLYMSGRTGYWQLCVYNGTINTGSFVKRLRSTDSNLPDADHPLTVTAGQVIVITRGGTGSNACVVTTTWGCSYIVKGSAVDLSTANDHMCIKYSTPNENYITELLQIFVPTTHGYIRYDYGHINNNLINANVWHIVKATFVDKKYRNPVPLTTTGEWECAVKLYGRTDFSGGAAHGDEITDDIKFFVDRLPVDITTFTNVSQINNLEIVQTSIMYDPSDNQTEIAEHGERYVFGIDGIDIKQSITWKIAEQLDTCYMAMFPASKDVTDYLYTDNDYIIKTLPQVVTAKKAHECIIFSDEFSAKFAIGDYPEGIDQGQAASDRFLCTDNGGGAYNKCYYQITSNNGTASTTIGEVWKSHTMYNLYYNQTKKHK